MTRLRRFMCCPPRAFVQEGDGRWSNSSLADRRRKMALVRARHDAPCAATGRGQRELGNRTICRDAADLAGVVFSEPKRASPVVMPVGALVAARTSPLPSIESEFGHLLRLKHRPIGLADADFFQGTVQRRRRCRLMARPDPPD